VPPELPVVEIKPLANRHSLLFSILGGTSAFLSLFVLLAFPKLPALPFYLMLGAALFTLLIGILKHLEPKVSLRLCPNYLQFFHRYGQWTLAWSDIQRIDIPRLGLTDGYQQLAYIGIKLTSQHRLLSTISLRLASRILLEQRPILMQVLSSDCPDGRCPSELMFETDPYTDDKNETHTGLLAMLGNRMTQLREKLGFDIYIPENALDRDAESFVLLLRQYHSQVRSSND
jgi:hypothetical protein